MLHIGQIRCVCPHSTHHLPSPFLQLVGPIAGKIMSLGALATEELIKGDWSNLWS